MQNDRPEVEEVELDPRQSDGIKKKLIKVEADNANKGRNIGLFIILLGVVLMLLGVTGSANLVLSGAGLKAKLSNAAPGIILMVIGLVVIWRTNLRITAAKKK